MGSAACGQRAVLDAQRPGARWVLPSLPWAPSCGRPLPLPGPSGFRGYRELTPAGRVFITPGSHPPPFETLLN